MLDSLRKGAGTWVAKIFIAILVLSFAVWGIADIFTGTNQARLGEIGDIEITAADYQRAYQNEMQLLSRQLQRQVTPQMAKNLGVESRVIQRLVAGASVDAHAQDLGVGISDDAMLELIRKDPAFQGSNGNFNRLTFDQAIRNAGLSEQGYIIERKESAIRGQLTTIISKGPSSTKTMLDATNQYWSAQREVEFFNITTKNIDKIEPASEETLRSHYNDNKSKYIAPQYRDVNVIFLSADDVKDEVKVTAEDAKKYYDANLSKYEVKEKRTIQQIPFPDAKSAEEAAKKIKAGKSFEDIAKDRGLSEEDLTLGTVTKDEILDKAIAEAAFALKKDKVSAPVKGNFTTFLLRVTSVVEGLTRSFDEMKEQITTELQKNGAAEKVLALYEAIEDARGGGATLAEAVANQKVKLTKISTTNSGETPNGTKIGSLTNKSALVDAIYASDIDIENDPVELPGDAYAWFEVTGVNAAEQRNFEDARKTVEKDWMKAETDKKLTELAKSLVERGNKGEAMKDLAKAAKAKLEKPISFTRSANLKGFPRAGTVRTFSLKKGEVASTTTEGEQGRAIFKLIAIKEPTDDVIAASKKTLEERLQNNVIDGLIAQYVAGLQTKYGANLNQQAIDQITNATSRYQR